MTNTNIEHPEATKEHLVSLAKTVPGAWVGLKIAALLLVIEGQRPSWIAEVLGVTRMSLNRWVRGINEKGVEALAEKPRPGRPARLTLKLSRQLEEHLEESPQAYGLNRARWDGPTLVTHLQRQFGIKLRVRQAQNWMHQLGYRLKRAGHVYLQAKADEAQKFAKALKKTQGSGS